MTGTHYIVVTLHFPGGFHSRFLFDEADQLPAESRSYGYSQIILAFSPSDLSAATDFALRADTLRNTDPRFRHLQVGVAAGSLRHRTMPNLRSTASHGIGIGPARTR